MDHILSRGIFDVNKQGRDNRTPLSLAAGGAHVPVLASLLQEQDVNPNLPDRFGSSPIFWAVSANSLQAVKQLLKDTRTNPEHLDLNFRSALS